MTAPGSTILIVDDEPVIHSVIRETLSKKGRTLLFASTVKEGLEMARAADGLDVALLDKNLPDGSGMDVARELKQLDPAPEIILMTAYASLDSAVEALKIGAFDYITKPFDDINKLALQVQNALNTAQLRHEKQRLILKLTESEQRYALAAQGANDGLWDWDLRSNELYYSDRWKAMLGIEGDDIGTSPDEWMSRIHDDDAERVKAAIKSHLDGHVDQFEDEHRMQHKDGTFRWVLSRGLAIRDKDGKATRMAGSQTDVTERRLAEQQLQYDALHDAVTLLPNRVLFLDRLGQALARSRRRNDYRFAVVLLDLDRFKIVNESLGHSVGDELLVATARRLETCLRAGDTAARLGGDEFAILLDDVKDTADAVRVAERVQVEVRAPHNFSGQDVFTTTSIGIALSNASYERPEELLRDADIAMYRAKSLGKARHIIFDPAMHGRAIRMLELDSALRLAVERDEFVMHYQPIISLDSGTIIGFEALIRWQHPERGLVPPGEFIPIAEDTGLIIPMSAIVLRKASAQLREWNDRLKPETPYYVSVNISAKHLVTRGLVDEIKTIMAETGIRPSDLRIEITESVVMENSELAEAALEGIKDLGVQIYMDDFGTGYSSLSYLHRLPIDSLKVDRSFVSNLGIDGENSVIVHTIITLARVLGMEVIAEGIETAEQLAQLRALKCDHGQGFYMSRPLPPDKLEELLATDPEW